MEKILKLTEKELEIVNMLVDEEYEILKANASDDKHIDITDLLSIKAKLVLVDVKTSINDDIRLGMEIKSITGSYEFDNIISFLKGEKNSSCYSFDRLKPFYDKYGYEKVNNLLLEYDREIKEQEEAEGQDE